MAGPAAAAAKHMPPAAFAACPLTVPLTVPLASAPGLGPSSLQVDVVVPQPGSDARYFSFTVEAGFKEDPLRRDMRPTLV